MHLTRIGKKAYGAVVGSRAVVIRGIVSNSLAKGTFRTHDPRRNNVGSTMAINNQT